jgi:hypothetical protein
LFSRIYWCNFATPLAILFMVRQCANHLFVMMILLSGASCAIGQSCDSTQWAQPGTYTVAVDSATFEGNIPSLGIIMLSGDDLCLIEASRKPTQNTQIHIGVYLVTIYPKKKFADATIEE